MTKSFVIVNEDFRQLEGRLDARRSLTQRSVLESCQSESSQREMACFASSAATESQVLHLATRSRIGLDPIRTPATDKPVQSSLARLPVHFPLKLHMVEKRSHEFKINSNCS